MKSNYLRFGTEQLIHPALGPPPAPIPDSRFKRTFRALVLAKQCHGQPTDGLATDRHTGQVPVGRPVFWSWTGPTVLSTSTDHQNVRPGTRPFGRPSD